MSIVTNTGDDGRTAVSTAQFCNARWFRKDFEATPEPAGGCAGLIFESTNYRANIWLNSARIATADETFSAFRVFNLDVAGRLRSGDECRGDGSFASTARRFYHRLCGLEPETGHLR